MQWHSRNHFVVDKQTFNAQFFFFFILRVLVEVVGPLVPQVGLWSILVKLFYIGEKTMVNLCLICFYVLFV